MPWPDSNLRPRASCICPSRAALYQLSYTTHRIYIPSYKQLAATPTYGNTAEPIRTIGLAIRILYSIRSVCCDVIATIQPSILTTSLGLALLPICPVCCCVTATVTHQLVMLTDSELTSSPLVVLTGWVPSLSTPSALRSISLPFQLMALHDPFGLLATTLAIVFQYIQPTCRDCTLHVPRRLWKVMDSNHRAFLLTTLCRSCLRPLSQPSCSVCRYGIATLTLTSWSSLTTLHLSFIISPDAIILCILCFG